MGCVLGIDAGTTALKVGVFTEDGSALSLASERYELSTSMPDRVEFDARRYWQATVSAVRLAIAESRIRREDLSAIAVSSQGETLIPVEADGTPVGRAIVWLDNRAASEADELADAFDSAAVYAATGVPAINPTWPACKLLWLRRHEPDRFARVARFLLVEDFLLHRLSGQFVTDGGVQCTSLLYDLRAHRWWGPMLDRLELSADRLPELTSPGSVVGSLTGSASTELGLPRAVQVVAAGMDQGAGAVGVGNIGPQIVSESTGGALTLQATVDRPDGDRTSRTPVYVHSAPGRYLYCPVCPTGGMALTWFRDRFGREEQERASAKGRDAYEFLTELAAGVPPGSDGLIMLPHLTGAFSPEYEPRARGTFFGFTLAHGKAHFVRAILEGVAYMLRRNLELLQEAGSTAREIRSHGGGARSDLWCQIKADVAGLPVITLRGENAAVRGDAMLAAVAVGAFGNLREASAAMVETRARFVPDPAIQPTYEAGYLRYQDLFRVLQPLYATSWHGPERAEREGAVHLSSPETARVTGDTR